MLRYTITLFLLFIVFSTGTIAQNQLYFTQHRPVDLDWQELNSPHFRIIFPKGHEEIARRAARILEDQYDETYALTGGTLKRFPVVLSTYNDLTNGFVSSVNFRSEVDIAPFKGKALNPQSGSWLETVLPHELLHANHANVTNTFSLASAFGLLSPDFRRSFNLFPPLGVHEGLAVYHESEHGLRETSGRTNYTFFNNQFNANLAGPNTWSMGQTLITSDQTLPRNRHYIAGASFTEWLHDTYGDDISKRAIRVHQNLFFLGYGYALKHVTGQWPGQLYQKYISQKNIEEDTRLTSFSSSTDDHHSFIGTPFKGVRQGRPIWISETEILYFSRQYNSPSGLYIYNFSTRKHRKFSERFLSSDYYMDYDPSSNHLFVAENFSLNRIFSNYQTDLVRINLTSGNEFRLTDGERVYAPEKTDDTFFAIQVDGDVSNIVEIRPQGTKKLTSFTDRTPIAVKASNVNQKELAVVMNQRGVQALWFVSQDRIAEDLKQLPAIAFPAGSIHDPVWHPTENKLLFTVDTYPAMNIYEYDLDTEILTQITNSVYNAFEASYSEDGSKIAYVNQVDNQQLITTLDRSDFFGRRVSSSELLTGSILKEEISTPFLGDQFIEESAQWKISDYSSNLSWLKPRAVIPVIKDKSGTTEWGAAFLSTDVLQSQLYAFEITTIQDELWYDLSYTNRSFLPGFSLSTYREPTFTSIAFTDNSNNEILRISSLIEEQGIGISSPIEYYFDKTDRFSSFFVRPGISYDQLQYNNLESNPISNQTTEWKGSIFTQLNIRLLQKSRDIQPASGIQLFAQLERVLNDTELQFETQSFRSDLLELEKRKANYYGINAYVAPFPKTNQSLLVSAQFLNQTDRRLFSNDTIIPLGFDNNLFFDSSSIGRFSTRYAIPLSYPDNGGLLVPFYISNIYMTLFTHTMLDYDDVQLDPFDTAQSVLGAGLHFRFKISNLALDLGFGLTYNPSTNTTDFILGSF